MPSHAHVGPRHAPSRSSSSTGKRRRAPERPARSRRHTARVAHHLHRTTVGRLVAAGLSALALTATGAVVVAGLVVDPAVAQNPAPVRRVAEAGIAQAPALASATVAQLAPTHAELGVQAAVTANPVPAAASQHAIKPRFGIDVSWPQCGAALPTIQLDFAVIGLTDGHADSVNPCLSEQVAWAQSQNLRVALYVVPSSPGTAATATMRTAAPTTCVSADATCPAYQAGVRQAQHAMAAAAAAKIPRTGWWLDVEESAAGTLWSADTVANTALLKGWVDALRAAHLPVGAYSTHGYWTMITGGWDAGLPQWVPVGTDGITDAQVACTQPFTSGPVVMTQWLTGPYDGNMLCPTDDGDPLARAFTGPRWHTPTTAGVPALLTTPVPHPELEPGPPADEACDGDPADDAGSRAGPTSGPKKPAKDDDADPTCSDSSADDGSDDPKGDHPGKPGQPKQHPKHPVKPQPIVPKAHHPKPKAHQPKAHHPQPKHHH